MIPAQHFRFQRKVSSSYFSQTLSQRINEYFQTHDNSRHANWMMIFKTVLGFMLWIGTYLWLIGGRLSSLQVIGVYVLHGYAQLYMGLNIAHDANHGAYSSIQPVNRTLGYVFDLVGLSSYMWRLMHNDAHHVFVNVRGADTALISGRIFRFTPQDKRRSLHRYQHLYAPLLYCLSTLDWVLAKDYRWLLLQKRFGNRRIDKHPPRQLVLLFAGKIFYYTYTLVFPMLYLRTQWYVVILGFVVMHLFLGFTLALTFQPNHFTEDSSYPEVDAEGNLSNDYIQHIFQTTADYARRNPFVSWATGGLNLHIVHHMFPGICHVHYAPLTRIIKSTAEECGLTYRENRTLTGAFLAHLRWMKILGSTDGDALGRSDYLSASETAKQNMNP